MKVPAAKKLPSGQWRCQIQIDGKRYSTTAATKREAERQAAGIKAGFVKAKERKNTLCLYDAITAYMECKAEVLSPSTLRGYKTIQDNYFKNIMKMDIYRMSVQAVQIAINDECRRHAPKTVRNAFGLLHTALAFYGVTLEGQIKLPQNSQKHQRWLQSEEIGKLLQEIDGDRCELPILLAVWLGMRRSEIMGLCWDCVDLEHGVLIVRRAFVCAPGGKWVLKDTTKTASSQRVLHLPDYIAERFRRLKPGKGRVFSGMHPGLPCKRLRIICQRAGITDTHLHGLRHTFAAVMLRQGVNERIVMQQGGWSSNRTMRQIYDYIMDEDARKAQQLRDNFFDPVQNAHASAHDDEKIQ